jgi:NNP family nitrate/nitrite transporter-like MFS transporter
VETAVEQSPASAAKESAAAYRNLAMATIGFGLAFWAWNPV